METGENIFSKIQEIFGDFDGSLSILEDQIDVDLQSEYFEYTKNHSIKINPVEVIKNKDEIFEKNVPLENKKSLLVQLAAIDHIDAFRTIERFVQDPGHMLHDWARLALQESKLLLVSKYLDESQLLISTGLGGKGLKLRYFTVFIARGNSILPWQKKSICNELKYLLTKQGGELEQVNFFDTFCTILSIVPLQVSVQELFDAVVAECNQLGNFLFRSYIITNVKLLTEEEIRHFIGEHQSELD